jgi:hypothetical protein
MKLDIEKADNGYILRFEQRFLTEDGEPSLLKEPYDYNPNKCFVYESFDSALLKLRERFQESEPVEFTHTKKGWKQKK